MFQFPAFAFFPYLIQEKILHLEVGNRKPGTMVFTIRLASEFRLLKWVSPFGNLRIKACSQLPGAYRSVPRPSSPVHAKASTECP